MIDFTQIAAGPYCSSLLGDLGADVISVEPRGGEPFRSIDNIFAPHVSAYHFGLNRSKRSMTLDLTTAEGRGVTRRLVEQADVVMVGFRMAAVRKLELTYEHLREANPALIYCSITAFGETGPRSDDPGMDILAQALGGTMGLTGEPNRTPVKVGPPVADFTVSFLAGFAICAALRARDRDGVGDKITLNLLDGQVACNANYITPYVKTGEPIRPMGGAHAQLVPYQVFRAKDTYFVAACLNDRFWPRFCDAIERPDLLAREDFATNVDRVENRDVLIPLLERLFVEAPAQRWLDAFHAAGVPCSPVNRLEDAIEDPQVVHNDMIVELEHPEHGTYSVANLPFRYEALDAGITRPTADLGEHSDEVLREIGYSAEEIAGLREREVV